MGGKNDPNIPVRCLVSVYFRKGKQRNTNLSKVKLTVLALSYKFCVYNNIVGRGCDLSSKLFFGIFAFLDHTSLKK